MESEQPPGATEEWYESAMAVDRNWNQAKAE